MSHARLVRVFGNLMHSSEDDADESWDCLASDSAYTCAIALFRRAAEPLDAMHPGLATLLTRNARRDEDLNVRLTELADHAAAWQLREGHFQREAITLVQELEGVLARVAAAERAAVGMRQELERVERRYMAHCASALQSVDASEWQLGASEAPLPSAAAERTPLFTAVQNGGEALFRFRLTA